MMKVKLYHGAFNNFTTPDLDKAKSSSDFGKAFYLSDNEEEPKSWISRGNPNRVKYIKEYIFTPTDDLNILKIDNKDFNQMKYWLSIISYNRNIKINGIDKLKTPDDVDIIIGPIFDNKWFELVTHYNSHSYYDYFLQVFIESVKEQQMQYAFRTDKSLQYLNLIQTYNLDNNNLLQDINKKVRDTCDFFDELYTDVAIELCNKLDISFNEALIMIFSSKSQNNNVYDGSQGVLNKDEILDDILNGNYHGRDTI